jgi:hypothetical protein
VAQIGIDDASTHPSPNAKEARIACVPAAASLRRADQAAFNLALGFASRQKTE